MTFDVALTTVISIDARINNRLSKRLNPYEREQRRKTANESAKTRRAANAKAKRCINEHGKSHGEIRPGTTKCDACHETHAGRGMAGTRKGRF